MEIALEERTWVTGWGSKKSEGRRCESVGVRERLGVGFQRRSRGQGGVQLWKWVPHVSERGPERRNRGRPGMRGDITTLTVRLLNTRHRSKHVCVYYLIWSRL